MILGSTAMAMRRAIVLLLIAMSAGAAAAAGPDAATLQRLRAFEDAVAKEPENLRLAADYRQLIIASDQYDRATRLLENLAKRRDSGPNVHVSLALAYVDKVPVTSRIRHLYLGRDAMGSLTKAIERRPTVLAYYVRGLINLFYNNVLFKRAPQGVADLNKAMGLVTPDTPPALVERAWVALGDGYWRMENPGKARETWSAAAVRFPDNAGLKDRLSGGEKTAFAVRHALDEDIRVDTSLVNLLPERSESTDRR